MCCFFKLSGVRPVTWMVLDTWVCLNLVSPLAVFLVFPDCCPILFLSLFLRLSCPLPPRVIHPREEWFSPLFYVYLIHIPSQWTYFRVGSRDAFKMPTFLTESIRRESFPANSGIAAPAAWIWQYTVTVRKCPVCTDGDRNPNRSLCLSYYQSHPHSIPRRRFFSPCVCMCAPNTQPGGSTCFLQ